jgi:uncharacterized OB-fold protein
MLWECSECGEITTTRAPVCPSCGTVGYCVRVKSTDDGGHEVGSLREYWIAAGAERRKPPPALER